MNSPNEPPEPYLSVARRLIEIGLRPNSRIRTETLGQLARGNICLLIRRRKAGKCKRRQINCLPRLDPQLFE